MTARDFSVRAPPFHQLRINNQPTKLASPLILSVAGINSYNGAVDKTVIAPINRLIPPEVLGDIFTAFLHSGDRVQYDSCCISVSGDSDVAPFVLGQVCWHWRELVLATPSLWSSVSINIPKRFHISLTKFWLSRAGECPISFRVNQSLNPSKEENEATQEILSILLCLSHRWRRVDLFFSSQGIQYPLESLADLSIPLLEDVSLDFLSMRNEHSVDRIWHKFHSAPRLQRLYWHSLNKELPSHAPWARLKFLRVKLAIHVDVLLDSLQACQALETLDVDVISALTPLTLLRSLTLEKLRTLKITFKTGVHYLYDYLNAPSLTCMVVEHQYGVEQPRKCQSFQKFLERSCCRLKVVEFWDTCLTRDEFLSYLEPTAMASVVKLILASEVNDDIAHLLAPRSDSAMAFLPQLEELEFIYGCENIALSLMASTRFTNRSCATLKTLIANNTTFDLHIRSIFDEIFHSVKVR